MKHKGLSDNEVKESLRKYGNNIIPETEPQTFLSAFMETFGDPMIKILLIIVAIMVGMFCFGYAEIYEPVGTIVAVLIVAYVSAKTSVASDVKYRDLKQKTKKDFCKVYRDNIIHTIPIENVVVGDEILLQAGDKVPADGILIEGKINVDNSALNGESEECKKIATDVNTELAEDITGDVFTDKYSLFRGAVVYDGEGILKVKKVGIKTMMGKMAEELQQDEPDSPLKVKLTKLAEQISLFGYIGAIVISIIYMAFFIINAGGIHSYLSIGWAQITQDLIKAISLAILIIVCAVPEGLPLMISLVLMQNTSKMLKHNVLVRKAEGIETAGSLNILFSDKTGTITKGSLEVVEFFTADGYDIPLKQLDKHRAIHDMLKLAIGKNTASMFDGNHKIIGGNATDQALLRLIGEENYIDLKQNSELEVGKIQSFNSENKFSQVEIKKLNKVFYKGAPEKILLSSTRAMSIDGEIVDFDIAVLNNKIEQLASRAMRVLAFGYSSSDFEENQINDDVVIIGFVAIRDDVREEAKEAIEEVQKAGIQVVMITGDRLDTAIAIAKDAGLLKNDKDIALTSNELNQMSDSEVKKVIRNIRVIARALPTDKSRMVRICQEMNLVVGMTGDGVNDSPALKRADVGFAMGSGTEAAKEAGEIVILDDNFKSVKDAIWYGRTIYHNILKFCKFQLVINITAVFVSALAPFFGIEEPLKITHLLFVNLVMDGLGAIMLGNEPALKRYMKELPRKRDENIVSKKMLLQILIMGTWLTTISFIFLKSDIFTPFFSTDSQRLTAYFVLFIVSALCNGFNVRDEGFSIFKGLDDNTGFLKVFFAIILVQVCIVNAGVIHGLEWLGKMFSCVPFSISGWIIVVLLSITMIPVDMIRKAFMKN